MGWPPEEEHVLGNEAPLWEVLLGMAVIIGIACTWLWSIQYAKEQALASIPPPPPPVVCPAVLEPDAVCPGWLFDSNLKDAKKRICRRPR
jgi:hypothetical protein